MIRMGAALTTTPGNILSLFTKVTQAILVKGAKYKVSEDQEPVSLTHAFCAEPLFAETDWAEFGKLVTNKWVRATWASAR